MITARLNTLLAAYQIARQQVGEANRGKALPGVCLRRCHKLRQIIWPEIHRVRRLLAFIKAYRAGNKETAMDQQYETGESPQHASRRQGDRIMPRIISALQEGAQLRIHTKVRRAAIEGLPARDSRNGMTISASRCLRLAKEGVIHEIGLDRYAMNPDFELKLTQTGAPK